MVQNVMAGQVSHAAGLNPRGSRAAKGSRKLTAALSQQTSRNVLDGDLIHHYLFLSLPERQELAKRLGTSNEQICDDLIELQRITTHY